ncbi:MAG: nuclear transport factor 2 family protein [Kiloniellales bacterium]
MSEESKLLFANEAFYAAFATRDFHAMQEAWCKEEPLFCLHPAWPLLVGRQAIMESWSSILSADGPTIGQEGAQAWIREGVGLVLCRERLAGGVLAATNLFRQEAGRWRLFHHHAAPTRDIATAEPGEKPLH